MSCTISPSLYTPTFSTFSRCVTVIRLVCCVRLPAPAQA